MLTSPRKRATETCRLVGFGATADLDDALVEWDYGTYEGRTTTEIRTEVAGWSLWRDGVPGGETVEAVAARADDLLQRLCEVEGDALLVSHGHFLRVLAARWIGLDPSGGRHLELASASLSILGWEREEPVLKRWNATSTDG